jgi:hypothetical protein
MESSDVQKFVLWSLDHVGWFPELWFPKVRREAIDFPSEPTDDEIHTALIRLIQAGSIEITKTVGTSSVRVRDPNPEVLEDLRTNGESDYKLELNERVRQQLHDALDRARVPLRGHFELFAHGDSFDVDAYLRSAPLDFDLVWRRREGGRPMSGVGKLLGNGAVIPLSEQQQIAAEFMSAKRDSLRELASFPGVETFILGLQFNMELKEGLMGFCLAPSAILMRHALEIGISPTFYVVLNRPGEPAAHGLSLPLFLHGW